MTPKRTIVVLCGLTILAYLPMWRAEFVYEDSVYAMWPPWLWTYLVTSRYLSTVTRVLEVWAFGQSPLVPHLVNLSLHLLCGWLVWRIARTMTTDAIGLLAAGLFLLHPLQTEAVMYVTGRAELVMTAATLCAVLWSLTKLTLRRALAIGMASVAAMMSKETGIVVLPLLALVAWSRGRLLYRPRLALLTGLACGMAFPRILVVLEQPGLPLEVQHGWFAFMAVQSAAVWRLFTLAIVPWGQTVDHDFALVPHPIALLAAGGLLAVLVWLWLARFAPVSIWLIWSVVAIAPRFVVRTPDYLTEHHLYLAMAGLMIALSMGITWAMEHLEHDMLNLSGLSWFPSRGRS